MIMRDEFLWVEKYRPKTIEDCILPTNIKKTFQDFLDKGCLLYTSPSPRDATLSRMPSSA